MKTSLLTAWTCAFLPAIAGYTALLGQIGWPWTLPDNLVLSLYILAIISLFAGHRKTCQAFDSLIRSHLARLGPMISPTREHVTAQIEKRYIRLYFILQAPTLFAFGSLLSGGNS